MICRIHVNTHVIKKNMKTGERLPPITIKEGKHNRRAFAVRILGPCRVVYSPDKPLPCGARLWIETTAKIEVDPA